MSQNHEIVIKSVTDLTEYLEETLDEGEIFSEEECNLHIDSLVQKNFLRSALHEDARFYVLNEHIPQSVCESQLTGIELLIIRQFYKNAKATFIVYNTQKGKTAILSKQIRQIKQNSNLKPIFYMIVSNDKTLADQSSESIQQTVEDCGCEVFTLSSSSKITFKDLKGAIDNYIAFDEYKTPVIIALANNQQLDKIMMLMAHVQFRNIRNPHVKNVPMFDEADETYQRIRDKTVRYNDKIESFLGMIDKENRSLEAVYWISATEGGLLEEYPECENAANYECDEEELSCPNYRAMHHPSTKFHIVKELSRESKNGYALRNIDENESHFMDPIVLPSGEIYFRKAIINSCSKRSSMVDLATTLRPSWHVMIFNQTGLTVFKHGDPVKKIIKTKGQRFNQLLFDTYKKYGLHDKPLAIMGNKKVNRGTSFHYAPKDGSEGLIWTDIILGNISDKNQAVQKGGRLAGKISQCPQYLENELCYWTTQNTVSLICTHNSRIDDINKNVSGCNIGDAFRSASERIKPTVVKHTIDKSKFRVYRDLQDMEHVVKDISGKTYIFQDPINGFIHTSLNGPSQIATVFDAIKKVNSGYTGQRDSNSGGRTVYPCYLDVTDPRTLLYVVLIDNLSISEEQKQVIVNYGKHEEIPQIDTGNLVETLKHRIFGI
jgi:hypothetical protein